MKFKQKLSVFFFITTTSYKRYTIKHTKLVNLHSLPVSCLEMVNIKKKKYDTVQSDICSKLVFHNRFLLPVQEWCTQLEGKGGGAAGLQLHKQIEILKTQIL